ncbi:Beta-galactosidase bgaB [Pontiella desulfatans]|uniref:Beta-galactosidase n=1 Tax=Pontiella desulfatans TaxID=2750659 RepID=A0A6C2UAK1_PONDE|nr:beta-galactosidase [Pontiella desulfatans]VGO16404.1 Beta-galactosidase bgaB [Pontiella desulfatans]
MKKFELPNIYFGGDYTPEHFPKDVMAEDMLLMKKAGVNIATINVFSWGQLQPDEDTWCFEWLDEIMDTLAANGVVADLGTATASTPAWMAKKYPEILPTDETGLRWNHGSRQCFNPNSPKYRELSATLVRKLAERYKDHPALSMWHVNNELSQMVGQDFSEISINKFRNWCKDKYGTCENLNQRLGLYFWGNNIYDWDELMPPMKTAHQHSTSLLLEWKRFINECYMEVAKAEIDILREITPDVLITTNFLYEYKMLDYHAWADMIDFISVSSFPDPKTTNHPGEAALSHDIMRGLKDQPFVLLEQAPSQVNWRLANVNKKPGVMRLWSHQGMARGSDGFLFFQWRASVHGSEKFHSAMVPHIGENSRAFREVTQLGNELPSLSEVVGSDVQADVAIVMDYNNWWTCEFTPGPTALLNYLENLQAYHYPLHEQNITTDVVPVDRDFSKYKVVIAPIMYMVKPGFKEAVEKFVAEGGTFITTFFSGVVNEDDEVFNGGYPGPLSDVLGLKVEEFEAMKPYIKNSMKMKDGQEFEARLWCDILQLDSAESLAEYGSDFFKGSPALTVNSFGKGKAYYVATLPDKAFMQQFLKQVCAEQGVEPVVDAPENVEAVVRSNGDQDYLFVMNHNYEPVDVTLPEGEYFDLLTQSTVEGTISMDAVQSLILKK